jgi:hypothetical protein
MDSSFLFNANECPVGHTTVGLSPHQLIDTCFYLGSIGDIAALNIHLQVFVRKCVWYIGMEWLAYMVSIGSLL